MNRFLTTITFSLACFLPLSARAAVQPEQPEIEVVFALDTTGSMGGLIQSAKEKIWSIASTMAQAKPTPKIKMGLLAYRDRGDAYVTQTFPITADLDAMYNSLMGFGADGGGDGPESVNQALNEAVTKFEWSSKPNVYRTIYLVGDAPPHMDYQDDVKYTQAVQTAVKKGIIINTIQCGADTTTTPIWKEIALKGEGKYLAVDQSGSAAPTTSPYDSDIARLSGALEGTKIFYGSRDEITKAERRDGVAKKIAAEAPASAVAGRAVLNASDAGKTNFEGDNELVSKVEAGEVDVKNMPVASLPDSLKDLAPADREKAIQAKVVERNKLKQEIQQLDEKRQAYLREEAKKTGADKASLDKGLADNLKEQAAKFGMKVEGDVKY